MTKIVVVDDNPEFSDTIVTNLLMAIQELKCDFEVINILPFRKIEHYFNYIVDNDVCALIMDEKLNDQAIDECGPISYKGSDLVSILRAKLKDFPIYSVTNYADSEELKEKESEFDDVIRRINFINNTQKYTSRIVRAASKYFQENIRELSRFNDLVSSVSGGDNDPKLVEELQALQVKLELPFSGFEDRKTWLDEYEKQISMLEEFRNKIEMKLGKGNELEENR